MPSETFFRLPQEKRQRLMDAAWGEFTVSKYADVSINKIIQKAGIPRGSFYQYFNDKEDLFSHLVTEVRGELLDMILPVTESGDVFSQTMEVFDLLLEEKSKPKLERCIAMFRNNSDMLRLVFEEKGENGFLRLFLCRADCSAMRGQEPLFMEEVFHFLMSSLGCALVTSLLNPGETERQRALLQVRMDIIKNGCLKHREEEQA